MVINVLGPILRCEWRLNSSEEALLTTIFFLGIVVSSPIVTKMADMYGRKVFLIFTCVWGFYFGSLSGFSPNFAWILVNKVEF